VPRMRPPAVKWFRKFHKQSPLVSAR
jgi:hypothetical protein